VRAAPADWLWGWDPTPGIVSVHAEHDGRATVWRRLPETGALVREDERFRPWLLLDGLDDLRHLGAALGPRATRARPCGIASSTARRPALARQRRGRPRPVRGAAARRLAATRPARRARRRAARRRGALPAPEEQYLVATGRTYFRDLPFDAIHRLQFDLETTGLDAGATASSWSRCATTAADTEVLEAPGEDAAAEADLIRRLVARVRDADPDVIENHNLHGFDLRSLDRRARTLTSRSRWAGPAGRGCGRGPRSTALPPGPDGAGAYASSRRGAS
jgi:hypothetical protein